VCTRVAALQSEKCGAFGNTINTTPAQCAQMFGDPIADPKDAEYREKVKSCVMEQTCDQVGACLASLSTPDTQKLRACNEGGGEAVGVTAEEYAQHNGGNLYVFNTVVSSKAAPIGRCGIDDANRWLTTLSCKDGSRPIRNNGDAEMLRVGNVGEAGRCHSIVDLYRVTCPEGATEIYIDAYVCPT
jgi:hypothetical protein